MSQQIRLQVLFTEESEKGSFTDALYFEPSEFEALSSGVLDALKQERIDAWLQVISNPTEPVKQTKEELQEQLASLDAVRDELILKISEKG